MLCYTLNRRCSVNAAVKFFNRVAEVAEQEGHHPDLHLTNYREVQVSRWTHLELNALQSILHPITQLFADAICLPGLTASAG